MTDKPKISIIVPVYNVKKFILKCIISIINQEEFDYFELIIVNDGSTDGSIDVIRNIIKNHSNIKLVNQQNSGVSCARNTGLRNATGEYISFIDSDDWIEKDMLITLYNKALSTNCQIVACSGDYVSARDNTIIRSIRCQNRVLDSSECLKLMMSKNAQFGNFLWNKIFDRQLFIENNIFFPRDKNFGEDALLVFILVYYANKVAFVEKSLYNYVQRKNSITTEIGLNELMYIDNIMSIKKFIIKNNEWDIYRQYYKNYFLRALLNINSKALRTYKHDSAKVLRKEINKILYNEHLFLIMINPYIEFRVKIKFALYKTRFDFLLFQTILK